jgi:hypothetical protein
VLAPSIHLHFVEHIVSPLPLDFWRRIELREVETYVSPHICSLFLSVIWPCAALLSRGPKLSYDLTKPTLCLVVTMDREKLEAVASHQFNPRVQFEFGTFRLPNAPLSVDSVHRERIDLSNMPMDLFNNIFHECKYLRHFGIPYDLVRWTGNDSISCAANPNFESLTINNVVNGAISVHLMRGIALNGCIKELSIEFRIETRRLADSSCWSTINYLFLNVVAGHHSLRKLVIKFLNRTVDPIMFSMEMANLRYTFEDFREAASNCIVGALAGMRKKRKFNSLSCLKLSYTFDCKSERDLQSNALWDAYVSPSLELNWFRQHAKEQTTLISAGLVAWVVRAINRGSVYAKTSPRLPHDARTGNAGLIYDGLCSFRVSPGAFVRKAPRTWAHEHWKSVKKHAAT